MTHNHDHQHHMPAAVPTTTPCPMHAAKMLQQQNGTDVITATVASVVNHVMSGGSGGHHHGHHMMGDMNDNGSDMDMMMMYFHGGYKEVILFDFWRTRSIIIFVVSCLALFVIAALYEGIKLLRETLIRQEILHNSTLLEQHQSSDENARSLLNQNNSAHTATAVNNNNDLIVDVNIPNSNEATSVTKRQANLFQQRSRLLSRGHIIQTFLHMFQVTISYLLMLVFMTYNSWLCLSVVLGAGVGYFFFGYKRLTTIDANEHCH